MYIYNDFFGYAVLDLVDHTLSSIHTFVVKRRYLEAWRLLHCLILFSDEYGDWQHVDDGERVIATVKAFGAMLMTTLRGLDKSTPSLLTEAALPELEEALEAAARVFDDDEEPYRQVICAYGKRIFGERTPEERKMMRAARYDAFYEFIRGLSEEEREKRNIKIADEEEEKQLQKEAEEEREAQGDKGEEDDKPWYGDANVKDIEMNPQGFRVSPTWKQYKEILSESPGVPFRGPPVWDLTEWTEKEKKPFTL